MVLRQCSVAGVQRCRRVESCSGAALQLCSVASTQGAEEGTACRRRGLGRSQG